MTAAAPFAIRHPGRSGQYDGAAELLAIAGSTHDAEVGVPALGDQPV